MNNKPLVSIITPCYNGEKYVRNFLESVLNQSYKNIELIFVNDGSSDSTEMIVKEYEKKFEENGMHLIYIYQQNKGQAAAVNQGLAIFNGEYLMWVDSDDILLENNIQEKLDYLNKHPECGFVLCEGTIVDESDLETPIRTIGRVKPDGEDNLFEDLLMERNVVYGPGTILVRREAMLRAIPSRQIYEGTQGQNWQMILPLAYNYKCGYIQKPLFLYVAHNDSHSRRKRTSEQELQRIYGFMDLLTNTIKRIEGIDEDKYLDILRVKYAKRILKLAQEGLSGKHREIVKQQYDYLKKYKNCTKWDTLHYICYCIVGNVRK